MASAKPPRKRSPVRKSDAFGWMEHVCHRQVQPQLQPLHHWRRWLLLLLWNGHDWCQSDDQML